MKYLTTGSLTVATDKLVRVNVKRWGVVGGNPRYLLYHIASTHDTVSNISCYKTLLRDLNNMFKNMFYSILQW